MTLYAQWLAPVDHLVISEFAPLGGDAGAIAKREFVELYNPTDIPITLDGATGSPSAGTTAPRTGWPTPTGWMAISTCP